MKSISERIHELSGRLEFSGDAELSLLKTDWEDKRSVSISDNKSFFYNEVIFNIFLKGAIHSAEYNSVPEELKDIIEKTPDKFSSFLDVIPSKEKNREVLIKSAQFGFGKEEELTPEKLGRIYEGLTSNNIRKKRGWFRTPPKIARDMAEKVVSSQPEVVLDPGIGAGVLSQNVIEYSENSGHSVESIIGVDIDGLSLSMAKVGLYGTNTEVHLKRKNFIDMSKGSFNQEIDAIISNPPYTRYQNMSHEMREKIQHSFSVNFSKFSPLYSFFFVQAKRLIKPGGEIVFLTPVDFMQTKYGADLKQYLLDNYTILSFTLKAQGNTPFEESVITGCVSHLTTSTDSNKGNIAFINKQTTTERQVDSNTISPQENWSHLFYSETQVPESQLVPLGEFSEVKRGILTGDNSFFCLSEEERKARYIPQTTLEPIVRKASSLTEVKFTYKDWSVLLQAGVPVWVLYHINPAPKPVQVYLQEGEKKGINERYVTGNRRTWYRVDRREPPDILFKYMSTENSKNKFVYNQFGVRNLNNLHGISLNKEYTETEKKALTMYLNAPLSDKILKKYDRTYASGLSKLEPGELSKVPVLDPKSLPSTEVKRLASLLDALYDGRDKSEVFQTLNNIIEQNLL